MIILQRPALRIIYSACLWCMVISSLLSNGRADDELSSLSSPNASPGPSFGASSSSITPSPLVSNNSYSQTIIPLNFKTNITLTGTLANEQSIVYTLIVTPDRTLGISYSYSGNISVVVSWPLHQTSGTVVIYEQVVLNASILFSRRVNMSTEYFITLNGGLNEGGMNSTYSMKVSNTLTLEEWLVAVIVIAALVGAFAIGTALLLGVILISKLSSKTNTQSATTCSSSKNVSISQQELNSNKQNGPFWEPTGNEEQSGMIA